MIHQRAMRAFTRIERGRHDGSTASALGIQQQHPFFVVYKNNVFSLVFNKQVQYHFNIVIVSTTITIIIIVNNHYKKGSQYLDNYNILDYFIPRY